MRLEGGEVHTGFWWGCQRVRDHLEGPKDNTKIDVQEELGGRA